MTKHRLQVVEGCNGFYCYHNPSGRCKGMGDGVDEEFYHEGLDRVATLMDEERFVEAWQADVDENMCEYMEAYFPQLYELEVYRAAGRLFVVTETGVANTFETALVDGLFIAADGHWQSGAVIEARLSSYARVSYLDLSWEEQAAIADALDEYEEAS